LDKYRPKSQTCFSKIFIPFAFAEDLAEKANLLPVASLADRGRSPTGFPVTPQDVSLAMRLLLRQGWRFTTSKICVAGCRERQEKID